MMRGACLAVVWLGLAAAVLAEEEQPAATEPASEEAESSSVARVQELATALREAQEEVAAGRRPEALARIEAAEGHQADAALLLLKAKLLFSMNRREDALVTVTLASSLEPLEVEASYLSALFAFATGRLTESLAAVDRTLKLAPRAGDAWALRGSTLARLTRLEDALGSFERALELGYDSPQMRLDWAGVLSDLGRDDASEAQFEARRKLTGG